ncbi:uncharacterized protein [Diadema antillarum]|uniref:uncharacterized protein n=1 Tax=Diadema antillarum TaxID=105358 RepID=UPI003A85C432
MAGAAMVSGTAGNDNSPTPTTPREEPRPTPPPTNEPSVSRLGALRQRWQATGISQHAAKLLSSSWRDNTNKQYEGAWRQWHRWCSEQPCDLFNPSIENVVNFLSYQHSLNKTYSTINSYRSALSSILPKIEGYDIGKHPLVVRLMKGVFDFDPPEPKYNKTWDVAIVLNHFVSLQDNHELSLLALSQKLLSLLALVSAQRTQTLRYLDLNFMTLSADEATFHVRDILKTTSTKKGISNQVTKVPSFTSNPKLCVLSTLQEYIKRTEPLRRVSSESKLLISTKHPHKSVTTSTLALWLKASLAAAGINTSTFSAHSYRSAATSKAFAHGVSLNEIMSTADWTNAGTFRTFYLKPIDSTFSSTILSSSESGRHM